MVSINPLNPKHISRLRRSRELAYDAMDKFRQKRFAAVQQFVGQHYSDQGSETPVPVNEIALFVNVMLRSLAPRAPKTLVRPRQGYRELSSLAWDFEIALNTTLRRIAFGKSLRLCVLDAIFSNGFMKIALHEEGTAVINGNRVSGYHPFADPIDLDDFVVDLQAKRWDKATFIGDRYQLDYQTVMESPLYDQRAKSGLTPSDPTDHNEDGGSRVDSIGSEVTTGEEEFKDKLDVWDLYLPQEQLVITLTADDERRPLRIAEWNGPNLGPYLQLGFIDVPNSIMKQGPVNIMMDLHILANELYAKARDQGVEQKTVLGVMPEAADDAESIKRAGHGDIIKLLHPDKIKEFQFLGVDQATLAFALEAMQRFSYFAGNLDVLGGLGVQADTAKQEEMISSSASAQIQDWQAITADFVRDCCERLGSLLWNDPIIRMPLSRRPDGVENLPIDQAFVWGPEHRLGEFERYNIEINPYSLRDKTPQQQLNTVMMFLERAFAPNAQFAIQQGVGLNFEGLARLWAKLADLDEIEEVLTFDGPPMADRKGPIGQPAAKPAVTKRTYERINRPGIKPSGQTQIMQQLLMGSKLQPGQQQALGRAAG